uniref:Uncharacterized protein n=1 Tax=Arundo donax TaxID=35708 RepID=A0A0A9C6D8_ARUDO
MAMARMEVSMTKPGQGYTMCFLGHCVTWTIQVSSLACSCPCCRRDASQM